MRRISVKEAKANFNNNISKKDHYIELFTNALDNIIDSAIFNLSSQGISKFSCFMNKYTGVVDGLNDYLDTLAGEFELFEFFNIVKIRLGNIYSKLGYVVQMHETDSIINIIW